MKLALAEDSQNFSVGGRAITGLTSLRRTGCLHERDLAWDSHCMRRFVIRVSSPMISEINGTVFDRPIAQFRVIPYLARSRIDIPDLSVLDVPARRILDMVSSYDDGVESGDDRDVRDVVEDEL